MKEELELTLLDFIEHNFFIGINATFNKKLVKGFKDQFSPLTKNCKKTIDIADTTFSKFSKTRQYPIKKIFRIIHLLDINYNDLQKNIIYIKSGATGGFSKPIFPIRQSNDLSRVIAHLLGDGCLSLGSKNLINCTYYNQEKVLLKSFENDIKRVFGVKKCSKGINKTTRFVRVPSSTAWILLKLVNNFNSKTANVPIFIKSANKEIKKEFVKSFFDDEAHVCYRPPHRYIEVALCNKTLLEEIKSLLKNFNIKTTKTYDKKIGGFNVYYFYIKHYHNLKKYHDEIGFLHPSKQLNLERILKSPGRKSYSNGETERKILSLIKIGKTTSGILGKELDRKRCTVNHYLSRLSKKEKIKKVGIKNGTREIIWKIENDRINNRRKG